MSVECNLIMSILKLSPKGPVLTENVTKEARIPSSTMRKLLQKLQNEGLIYLKQDSVEVENNGRLKLGSQSSITWSRLRTHQQFALLARV